MGRFDSIKEMKSDYEKKVKAEGSKLVSLELNDLFKKFPKLEAIRWRQYTPYFNDGDECIFSVREIEVKATGLKDKYDSEAEFTEYIDDYDKALGNAISKLNKEFEELSDILKEAFGDHQEVTVSRNGNKIDVESEDYDHD